MKNVIESAQEEIRQLTKEISSLEERLENKRKTRDMLDVFIKQNSNTCHCHMCDRDVPIYDAVRVIISVEQPHKKTATYNVCNGCIDLLI